MNKKVRKFLLTNLLALALLITGLAVYEILRPTGSEVNAMDTSPQETTSTGHIAIISGHGYSESGSYDSGAIAIDGTFEADLNLELAALIKNRLNELGIRVDTFDENVYRNMYVHKKDYNFSSYDFVLELHFNASENQAYNGTEVIYNSFYKNDLSFQQAIADALEPIFKTARLYEDDTLYTQRMIAKQGVPSMLLETCYIDNSIDYDIYKVSKENIASIIATVIERMIDTVSKD